MTVGPKKYRGLRRKIETEVLRKTIRDKTKEIRCFEKENNKNKVEESLTDFSREAVMEGRIKWDESFKDKIEKR